MIKANEGVPAALMQSYEEKGKSYYAVERREMLPFVPRNAKRILDVGCGAGGFSALLKEKLGAEVWGVELLSDAASIAESRIDRVVNGSFEPCDLLPEKYFDAIVFNDVLEHLSTPESALAYARSLLGPGGRVVASIPNFRHFPNVWAFIVKKSLRYEEWGIMDRTHLRVFTESSIRALFESCGFEVVGITGINGEFGIDWKFRLANFLTAGWIDDMRWLQFAVVARPRE
jgi:2-polyprenyl-3-methyl-5-hydroxy-6-metoxy-1,4-benzoquinol methylase